MERGGECGREGAQSLAAGSGLGHPVVPVYRFYFGGGFPYTKIDYRKRQKKVGTNILSSLLEDLVAGFLRMAQVIDFWCE